MSLLEAENGKSYTINKINTNDSDVKQFLFHLGCYSSENYIYY